MPSTRAWIARKQICTALPSLPLGFCPVVVKEMSKKKSVPADPIIPGLASEGLKRTRDALRRGVITVGMTRDQALAALRADRALHA